MSKKMILGIISMAIGLSSLVCVVIFGFDMLLEIARMQREHIKQHWELITAGVLFTLGGVTLIALDE